VDTDNYSFGAPLDLSYSVSLRSDQKLPHTRSRTSSSSSSGTYRPFSQNNKTACSEEEQTPLTSTSSSSFGLNPHSKAFEPSAGTDQPILLSSPDHVESLFTFEYKAASEPFPESQVIIAPTPIKAGKGTAKTVRKRKTREEETVELLCNIVEDSGTSSSQALVSLPSRHNLQDESRSLEDRIQDAIERVETLVDLADEMSVADTLGDNRVARLRGLYTNPARSIESSQKVDLDEAKKGRAEHDRYPAAYQHTNGNHGSASGSSIARLTGIAPAVGFLYTDAGQRLTHVDKGGPYASSSRSSFRLTDPNFEIYYIRVRCIVVTAFVQNKPTLCTPIIRRLATTLGAKIVAEYGTREVQADICALASGEADLQYQ
jgi:hypothetical protein